MGTFRSGWPGRGTLFTAALIVVFGVGCSGTEPATGDAAQSPTTDVVSSITPAPTVSTSSAVAQSSSPEASSEICEGDGTSAHLDIAYDAIDGVDPNLLSIDVYEPVRDAACPGAPIMVYVHGGGWWEGDKSEGLFDKVSWFNEMGWVFVSVNYRLSPVGNTGDPDRVMYPIHHEDLAAAVAWVHDNASDAGADSNAISLMGHSAGAEIIAAVATDERYLAAHGLALDTIRCAVPLDTPAYDIRALIDALTDAGGPANTYLNAFSLDPETWDEASPFNHVEAGKNIADFFVVTRGAPIRIEQSQAFAAALLAADSAVEVLKPLDLDHGQVNRVIGSPDDNLITPELDRFLDGCVS